METKQRKLTIGQLDIQIRPKMIRQCRHRIRADQPGHAKRTGRQGRKRCVHQHGCRFAIDQPRAGIGHRFVGRIVEQGEARRRSVRDSAVLVLIEHAVEQRIQPHRHRVLPAPGEIGFDARRHDQPRTIIVIAFLAAVVMHALHSVGGEDGKAVAVATMLSCPSMYASASPSSSIVLVDCEAMRTAPHAVRIPSTAVSRPWIPWGYRRGIGSIGKTPWHCGQLTLCPTPATGFPWMVTDGSPSRTQPPCVVVSPAQMIARRAN
ncbi:hypothetical protein BLKGLAD_67120 [Burkholderia gladioli pv. gladioli]